MPTTSQRQNLWPTHDEIRLKFGYGHKDCLLMMESSVDGISWVQKDLCLLQVNESEVVVSEQMLEGVKYVRFVTKSGSDELRSSTIDLDSAANPIIGDVTAKINKGEDMATFSVPVYSLGAGVKRAKIYVWYGIEGSETFRKEQVATITEPGTFSVQVSNLTADKTYRWKIIVQNSVGGIV